MNTYRKDCFYFSEVTDYGGHIPFCGVTAKPEDCPCRDCKNYISKSDAYQVVRKHQNAPTVGWISVKERLPEIDQIVLTYCNDRGAEYKVLRRAFSDLYKAAGLGDGWYWESIDYMTEYPDEFGYGEVTHWMPLPEPPEEMKGEKK